MRARVATLLLAACVAPGCPSLADRIAEPAPDTRLDRLISANEQALGIMHAEWRTADGIALAYRIVPATQ